MISTNPYKGTKDFYPEDMAIQNFIFNGWKYVCESHGFLEYQTPIIENAEIYRAKSGEDVGNKELFTFSDLAERDLALRPEMTPSVTRMVSAKYKEMSKPIKLFSIGSFYRNEKPQKGRNREFWQLNADIFGDESIYADVEILNLSINIMRHFKAPAESFIVNINHRNLINLFLDSLKISDSDKVLVIRIIDKFEKIPEVKFKEEILKITSEENYKQINKFLNSSFNELNTLFPSLKENLGYQNLNKILEILKRLNLDENVKFKSSLVRGFDYYDGLVFEVNDQNKENPRSLFGGGRYNGLADIFGGQNFPAVGFAPGNETFRIFLENWNLLPQYDKLTKKKKIYVFAIHNHSNEKDTHVLQEQAFMVSNEIRNLVKNVFVDLSLNPKTTSSGLEFSSKKNFDYCVIVGEDEIKEGTVTIKKLSDGSQFTLSLHNLIDYLKKNSAHETD
jgi:histidyl-tRNA synthetase